MFILPFLTFVSSVDDFNFSDSDLFHYRTKTLLDRIQDANWLKWFGEFKCD